MKHCDKCGKKIQDGKCSCGIWKEALEDDPLFAAMDTFHEMKRFSLTGDAPHLGCAVVFFRGDYNDTKKVERFIYEMKGRPYFDKME